jgi:biopolymer transport protein ExbB
MFNILLFFQQAPAAVVAATEANPAAKSAFELLSESPIGLSIMIILLIMSAVVVGIFISRYATIKKAGEIDDSFMNNIRAHVQAGNIGAARALCQSTSSPVARMVEKGLMRIGKPMADIEHAIENVGKLEVYKLEKNVNILSIIAGVAPMFGFLGTIAGMIQTFGDLATKNNLSIGTISGGIYVKMFTSGAGLIVGIIAFVGFNYLNTMIDRVVNRMENSTFEFIDLLQEPAN